MAAHGARKMSSMTIPEEWSASSVSIVNDYGAIDTPWFDDKYRAEVNS
jgi:hypothetical protein